MTNSKPVLASALSRFLFLVEGYQVLSQFRGAALATRNRELLDTYKSIAFEVFSQHISEISSLLAKSTGLDAVTQILLTDSLQFDSYVTSDKMDDSFIVYHNFGTALAIDDLASRLVSHKEFLTLEYHDGTRSKIRHQDDAVRFATPLYPPGNPKYVPRKRYLDYTPSRYTNTKILVSSSAPAFPLWTRGAARWLT